MVINKIRRKEKEPQLWPDNLNEKSFEPKEVAGICGFYFENLTAELFKTEMYTTNGESDICPDCISGDTLIESKASGFKSQFKICADQLNRYEDASQNGWTVYYALWTYYNDHIQSKCKTNGDIVRLLQSAQKRVCIMDHKALLELIKLQPEGVRQKVYRSWAGINLIMIAQSCLDTWFAEGIKLPGFTSKRTTKNKIKILRISQEVPF